MGDCVQTAAEEFPIVEAVVVASPQQQVQLAENEMNAVHDDGHNGNDAEDFIPLVATDSPAKKRFARRSSSKNMPTWKPRAPARKSDQNHRYYDDDNAAGEMTNVPNFAHPLPQHQSSFGGDRGAGGNFSNHPTTTYRNFSAAPTAAVNGRPQYHHHPHHPPPPLISFSRSHGASGGASNNYGGNAPPAAGNWQGHGNVRKHYPRQPSAATYPHPTDGYSRFPPKWRQPPQQSQQHRAQPQQRSPKKGWVASRNSPPKRQGQEHHAQTTEPGNVEARRLYARLANELDEMLRSLERNEIDEPTTASGGEVGNLLKDLVKTAPLIDLAAAEDNAEQEQTGIDDEEDQVEWLATTTTSEKLYKREEGQISIRATPLKSRKSSKAAKRTHRALIEAAAATLEKAPQELAFTPPRQSGSSGDGGGTATVIPQGQPIRSIGSARVEKGRIINESATEVHIIGKQPTNVKPKKMPPPPSPMIIHLSDDDDNNKEDNDSIQIMGDGEVLGGNTDCHSRGVNQPQLQQQVGGAPIVAETTTTITSSSMTSCEMAAVTTSTSRLTVVECLPLPSIFRSRRRYAQPLLISPSVTLPHSSLPPTQQCRWAMGWSQQEPLHQQHHGPSNDGGDGEFDLFGIRYFQDIPGEDLLPTKPRSSRYESAPFSLATYNVLCQASMDNTQYLYGHLYDRPALGEWESRRERLRIELDRLYADVICLQEVQAEHYIDFFAPYFAGRGYHSAIYTQRTNGVADGCATFYNPQRVACLQKREVYYNRGISGWMDKDNVGQVMLFEVRSIGAVLCVANTHILYNMKRGEVKLAQLATLLAEMHEFSSGAELERALLSSNSHSDQVKEELRFFAGHLLCGDLNLEPHSPLYRFLRHGRIQLATARGSNIGIYQGAPTYWSHQMAWPAPTAGLGSSSQLQNATSSSCVSTMESSSWRSDVVLLGQIPMAMRITSKCTYLNRGHGGEAFVDDDMEGGGGDAAGFVAAGGRQKQQHQQLTHDFAFASVYEHCSADGRFHEVSTYHKEYGCPDFIFYSTATPATTTVAGQLNSSNNNSEGQRPPAAGSVTETTRVAAAVPPRGQSGVGGAGETEVGVPLLEEGYIRLMRRLSLPSLEELHSACGRMPNEQSGSDHLPLMAEFQVLRPAARRGRCGGGCDEQPQLGDRNRSG